MTGYCLDCGREWHEEPFDAPLTPENAREILTSAISYIEELVCPDCGSRNIEITCS